MKHRKYLSKTRRLKYYKTYAVWNKGLSWPVEVREKIRQGCLNSSIGMSPKPREEQEQEEMEAII